MLEKNDLKSIKFQFLETKEGKFRLKKRKKIKIRVGISETVNKKPICSCEGQYI